MKGKRAYKNTLSYVLVVVLALHTACMWFAAPQWFYVSLALTALSLIATLVFALRTRRTFRRYLSDIAEQLSREDHTALSQFPLPVAVGASDGTVMWYNDDFQNQVLGETEACGLNFSDITGGYTVDTIRKKKTIDVVYGKKKYNVYVSVMTDRQGAELILLYYVDNTSLKEIAEEYTASRPVVLSVFIDNLEELSASVRESERSRIAGKVETLLEEWLGDDNGILQKYDSDRFLIITEKRRLEEMIRERFGILDTVREMPNNLHTAITLSIGVGQAKTVFAAWKSATRSLEMALGRGGDQAAVQTKNGFDFYGGVSKGVERRTKVRTRMVASALSELIQNSSKVLLMGHAFSDMDSVGSAVALALFARKHGKAAYVVVNREQTLAGEMIDYLRQREATLFLEPRDAEMLIDEKTLLIITDTHQPERVEAPSLLSRTKLKAVIDHHRRMVNAIEDAVLFYHEPTASSASEMVAELLQYMGDPVPEKIVAEALLAGIILDTRNFVIKAGARTFEAAAYLRRLGADTVQVQNLFAANMDLYCKKAALVSDSGIYKGMAISVGTGDDSESRIAAAQAANELLTIKDVKAAFTLLKTENGINFSARSYGDVNVQIIMEMLGGGGHLTMAGAFLKDVDADDAVIRLKSAVDAYLLEKKK